MDPRHHAWLARQLIDACGGLETSSQHCRLKRSRLSEASTAQGAEAGAYLAADVIADLEAYCGRPIYSQGMVDALPGEAPAGGLLEESCALTELAAHLQESVRKMERRGRFTAREGAVILAGIDGLASLVRALRLAEERGEP